MEKIIKMLGKYKRLLFLPLVLGSFIVHAHIRLELRSDSVTKNQVSLGQPFILDVIIDDIQGSVATPTLDGLKEFYVKHIGTQTTIINQTSSARYSYQVRIDTLGTYTVGPARIRYQQQEYTSQSLQITVVKDNFVQQQQQQIDKKDANKSDYKTILRLMIDQSTVVVGQKIHCILRFYYQDPSLSLTNVSMPELANFEIKKIGTLENGISTINDEEYRYAQWQWDMYPTQPAECIIPAYSADYEIPSKNNSVLGGFFMLLNRSERRRVYSNAISLKVKPLPPYQEEIKAVGIFDRFSAEITPSIIKEGEATTLIIELEGTGNFHDIDISNLQLPTALKYYRSQSSIIEPKHNDELSKKRFEFIIQGLQSGDYEIPQQLFTYFDIEKNDYVTLRSCTLSVHIAPEVVHQKKEFDHNNYSSTQLSLTSDRKDKEEIFFIGTDQCTALNAYRPLPWWLFYLLLVLPCFYASYSLWSVQWQRITGRSIFLLRRSIFKQAYKQILSCKRNNDTKQLYAIFVNMAEQLQQIKTIGPIEHSIADHKKKNWQEFLDLIAHAAYAQSNNNDKDLNEMALQWIYYLKKTL